MFALALTPVKQDLLDALVRFTDADWADLPAAFQTTGWPVPKNGLPPKRGGMRWKQDSYFVLSLQDGPAFAGLNVGFGLSYHVEDDDADDPDLVEFPARRLDRAWTVDRDSSQDAETAAFTAVRDQVAALLGEPDLDHLYDARENWRRAVWRRGAKLFGVSIGEDPRANSLYNRLHVATVLAPPAVVEASELDPEAVDEAFGI